MAVRLAHVAASVFVAKTPEGNAHRMRGACARAWRRVAAAAPIRFLPLFGETHAGERQLVAELDARAELGLRRVASPRHATLLLAVGSFPKRVHSAVQRVHDQLPHPRAAAQLRAGARLARSAAGAAPPGESLSCLPRAQSFELDDLAEDPALELAGALAALAREVILGRRRSADAILPDEPPSPWRGIGEHGQGGEGMLGGRPYGRPLAMTEDDLRDGLSLDRLAVRIGPFFPGLSPGLTVDLALQGDVVQRASIVEPPLLVTPASAFLRALSEPVPVSELETERARHHLYCLAEWCRVVGARALERRARCLARSPDPSGMRRFEQRVQRAVTTIPPGIGALTREAVARFAGPVARAAGSERDLRRCDPAVAPTYQQLGFVELDGDRAQRARSVHAAGGDTRSRVLQRAHEAARAAEIAVRAQAEGCCVGPLERVEAPEGPLGALEPPEWMEPDEVRARSSSTHRGGPGEGTSGDARAGQALAASLVGLEWSSMLSALASFGAGLDVPLRRARYARSASPKS